jgi:hypothetical protein
MCKRCDELARRVDDLEAAMRDMQAHCPCVIAKIAALKDQPTRRDIEIGRIGKRKWEGER